MTDRLAHLPRDCAKIGSSRGSLDHLVGDGEQRRRHVQANRLRHDQVNDEVDLVDHSTGRSAGFAPAKSCRPNRRRAAKVDEGHRADEDREFLFFVADVPDADYFTRCVLYWVITGLVQLAEDVDLAVESLTFIVRGRASSPSRTSSTAFGLSRSSLG